MGGRPGSEEGHTDRGLPELREGQHPHMRPGVSRNGLLEEEGSGNPGQAVISSEESEDTEVADGKKVPGRKDPGGKMAQIY